MQLSKQYIDDCHKMAQESCNKVEAQLLQIERLLTFMPTNRMQYADLSMEAEQNRIQFIKKLVNDRIELLAPFGKLDTTEKDLSLVDLASSFFIKTNDENNDQQKQFENSEIGKTYNWVNKQLSDLEINNWIQRALLALKLLSKSTHLSNADWLFMQYYFNYNVAYDFPKTSQILQITFIEKEINVAQFEENISNIIDKLWAKISAYIQYSNLDNIQKLNFQHLFSIGFSKQFELQTFADLPNNMVQELLAKGSIKNPDALCLESLQDLEVLNFVFLLEEEDNTYWILNLKNTKSTFYNLQNVCIKKPAERVDLSKKERITKNTGKAFFG